MINLEFVLLDIEFQRGPNDHVRKQWLGDPEHAYTYAYFIDKHSRDDTRAAASKAPKYAFKYATEVDKRPTIVTWDAVKRSWYWRRKYLKHFNVNEYELENTLIYSIL